MKTIVVSDAGQQIRLSTPGEYRVVLDKPGSEAEISGVFEVNHREHAAVTVVIHHQAPHTRARTTLKGAVRDEAKITFVGRIIIDEQCGDTNSFLTERILLLSDQAKAEAIPDLEIKTDDVKCSHAASISRIPDEQIFYLMSRGLSQSAAETLIVEAFLEI